MFACIFIPDFSAQAILRLEPELRARPVVVLAGRPPLEKVVALNERARQAGVEIGAIQVATGSMGEPGAACALGVAGDIGTRCAARLCAIVFSGGGRHIARHRAPESCRARAIARSTAEDCSRFGAAGFSDGTGSEPCRGRESGCCLARSPRFYRRDLDSRRARSRAAGRSAGGCFAGKFFFRCGGGHTLGGNV